MKILILTIGLIACAMPAVSKDGKSASEAQIKENRTPHKELFQKLIGRWEGRCRTWFEPGELADESDVKGEISIVLDGQFLRHAYEGKLKGKSRRGEELIGFNSIAKKYQACWVDDFHMNYAIMFSEGDGTDSGFTVRGGYDVGEGQPRWGWKTEFKLLDENHLTITAYNVYPDGMEAEAVETAYRRVKTPAGTVR